MTVLSFQDFMGRRKVALVAAAYDHEHQAYDKLLATRDRLCHLLKSQTDWPLEDIERAEAALEEAEALLNDMDRDNERDDPA